MEHSSDSKARLQALRELIQHGEASTQEELCKALKLKKFEVTQSTISRDLRRIGAIKVLNAQGETEYRLAEHHQVLPPKASQSLQLLIANIQANESMIVLHTSPGSASLVARQLDGRKSQIGILGTLAGDDTIFVVPETTKRISSIIKKIRLEFQITD